WPCEKPETTPTEGNRVLAALRVPSRLTAGRANIALERKIVLRVHNAPAFSHGQDPQRSSHALSRCNAATSRLLTSSQYPWGRHPPPRTDNLNRPPDSCLGTRLSQAPKSRAW